MQFTVQNFSDTPLQNRSSLAVTLVADAAMAQDASRAVELAGGRVVSRIGWLDVAAEFGTQARRTVVAVEAQGIDAGVLSEMLPRIDAAAIAADMQVVVALDARSIDVVTAATMGGNVQLLCSPTMAERVAALAVAGEAAQAPDLLSDSFRESEAARLQRLNEEVARIAEVLARLTRHEGLEAPVDTQRAEDRRDSYGHDVATTDVTVDAAHVRRAIRARRLRDTFFGSGLFEDPAWDMLLDLFAAELEGAQVSVSSLCIAAAVAPTTALRWIGKLADAGLFERRPDPIDRRRAFMVLTDRASEAMRAYVGSLQRAGLPLA